MEQRWGFLAPWCTFLKGRIKFADLECEENYADTMKNHLQVTFPSRNDVEGEHQGENTPVNPEPLLSREEKFLLTLQNVREALALLAAVAHVDDMAWKYLLRGPCAVTMGIKSPKGDEAMAKPLAAKFIWFVDMDGDHQGKADMVRLCGIHQRQHPSPQYLEELAKIAALDDILALRGRTVDVQIPVRVHVSTCLNTSEQRIVSALTEIQRQEKIIKAEWDAYRQTKKVEVGAVGAVSMRCTFVLEPMIVDLSDCTITEETANAMEKMVSENVWASEVSVKLAMTQLNEAREKMAFAQMTTSLFDSTRRLYGGANREYLPVGNVAQLQLGMVHLHCEVKLDELDLPALFSALAVTQTTKQFSIQVYSKFYGQDAGVQFWKWVAYAFFSTRAGSHSSIDSLTISDVGLLSAEEVQGFKAIMNSKHPEEEMFGLKPGHTSGKEATLSAGTPIKWQLDSQGRFKADFQPLTFASPIRFVRTFHDGGKSTWVNALVPGLGRCQVRRADLMFTHAKNPRKAVPSNVASFTIRFHGFMMWGHVDYLQVLLGIMGAQLKSLKIVCPSDAMDNNVVLEACPNLERMELWRGHSNVWFDFTEFHKQHKKLETLTYDGWEYKSLATDLSDRTNPLVLPVRGVLLHRLNPPDFGGRVVYDATIKTELETYLAMLDKNRSLEYLSVSLSTSFHKYKAAFKKHHLEPIDRIVKFPTPSKAAFLSVVYAKRTSTPKKRDYTGSPRVGIALGQLDSSLLSIIFGFAQVPALREVYVWLVDDGVAFGMSDDEDMMEDHDETRPVELL